MRPSAHPVNLPTVHPVERLSIIDQAEIQLRAAIYDGVLRPGDQVPEVQVAGRMGISRSSLREACQRLVRDGLLHQRPGRGVAVTLLDHESIDDFIQYRAAIENQAIRMITARVRALRDEDDELAITELLAPLQAKAEALCTALQAGDVLGAGNADLELHQGLAEQTGNRFLTTSMYTIAIMSRIAVFSDPLGFGLRPGVADQAQDLVAALRAGDEAAAGRILQQALASYVHRLGAETDQQHYTRGDDAAPAEDEAFRPLA